MCCINIHLTFNPLTLTNTVTVDMQFIVHDCYQDKTLINKVFYGFVEDFVHTQNPNNAN